MARFSTHGTAHQCPWLPKVGRLKPGHFRDAIARRERALCDACQRYIRLLREGDSACSHYDLSLGYDAAFSLRLVAGKIRSAKNDIAALGSELELVEGPQLPLKF
jgi:hypothetical protein